MSSLLLPQELVRTATAAASGTRSRHKHAHCLQCPLALPRLPLVPGRRCAAVPASDDKQLEEDLSEFMKQDLERFAKKQQQQQQQPLAGGSTTSEGQPAASSSLKDVVDKVLIADFFFVLLVLAWLGVGLAEKGALHSSTLIDAWMPLWPAVFQPAIGILMAGALVSGGLTWLSSRQSS